MRNEEPRLKFIKPMEPRLVKTAPVSDDWFHEIKYDGFRTQLILDWAGARAFSRNGHDWSKRYWPIVQAAEKLPAKSFIMDGEMIAPDEDGRPNFHAMHSRMTWNAEQLAYVPFDILHLDGRDLRAVPAIERKAILWDLVKPATGIIQYSVHVEGGGADFFEGVERMGLEGMVSKRRGSSYRSGASDAWLKIKCWETHDFELWGIRRRPGKRTEAIVGREGRYAGAPAINVTKEIRARLLKRMRTAPPAAVPRAIAGDDVEWLQPGIRARVRSLRGEAKLRHGSVTGILEG
ncbi:RNA ligase family protein [Mesorhizobium sp. M2A.F.Ca.ET.067.02.1.1]|uniref:ATP-dependent DNA ligase n=1 Tax=Mesorhizobium sp. M2A.F.Ca.ET.067.02.1.1 TaxID=2496749 RepID=UPI000FD48269|nr:RNA ligase family protein [Mesorhizobium sp. M2A.F.Ca.ET.067.02.1.1]RUW79636.1 DNA ligase [Mesorhizobium sp. M2A.F.Ca.ET.067.02.1.1]